MLIYNSITNTFEQQLWLTIRPFNDKWYLIRRATVGYSKRFRRWLVSDTIIGIYDDRKSAEAARKITSSDSTPVYLDAMNSITELTTNSITELTAHMYNRQGYLDE